jgi:hypothetical protein
MKLFGYRKMLVFVVSATCLMVAFYWALDAIEALDADKVTQLAAMLGGFFAAFGALVGAIVSALKGTYARDAQIGVAKCQAPKEIKP